MYKCTGWLDRCVRGRAMYMYGSRYLFCSLERKCGLTGNESMAKKLCGWNVKGVRSYMDKSMDDSGDVGEAKEKEGVRSSSVLDQQKGLRLVSSDESASDKLSLFSKYSALSEFYRIRQFVEELVGCMMVEGELLEYENEYVKLAFEEVRDMHFERRLELRAFSHLTRLYSELNISNRGGVGYNYGSTLGTTILLPLERESLVFQTIKRLALKYEARVMDLDLSLVFNTTAWITDSNATNSKTRQGYLAWEAYKKDPNHYEDEFLIVLESVISTIRRYEEEGVANIDGDGDGDGVGRNRPFIVVFRNLPQYISAMSSSYLAERVKSIRTPVFFVDMKIEQENYHGMSHMNPSVMSLISSSMAPSEDASGDGDGDENFFALTTPLFDNFKPVRNVKSIYQTKSYKQIFGVDPLVFNKPMNLQDGVEMGNGGSGMNGIGGIGPGIGTGNRDQASNKNSGPTSVSFAFILPNQQEASIIPSQVKSKQSPTNVDISTKILQMNMFLHYNMRNLIQCLNSYSIELADAKDERFDPLFVWCQSATDKLRLYDTVLGKLVYHRARKMTADEVLLIVNNALTLQQIQNHKVNKKLADYKGKKYLELKNLYMSLEMSICALNSNVLEEGGGEDMEGRLTESIVESFDRIMESFRSYFEDMRMKKNGENFAWRQNFNKQELTSAERHIYENYVQPSMISTTFDDIGSLEKAKDELESLMVPVKYPIFTKSNSLIRAPLGVLLYGPPGTGKTMLARALAKTAKANFIHISSSKIVSKWLGESEGNAAAVFSLAKKMSPCIIFFDEVDGLLSVRENHEHESTRRVKNEFFSGWDGLLSSSNLSEKNLSVTVIAATNRPFDLDDAALRRLPHRVIVDLPDMEARYEILKKTLRGINLSNDITFLSNAYKNHHADKNLSNIDKILYELASITEGYSGSDLKSVCTRAALQLVHDFMSDYKNNEHKDDQEILELAKKYAAKPLTFLEFKKALSEIGMSVDPKSKTFAEMRKWHETYGSKNNPKSLKRSSLGFY